MPNAKTQARQRRVPTLCLHKATGQAVVRLDGKDVYCGAHGSPGAREKYERVLAEWLLTRRPTADPPAGAQGRGQGLTVSELILAYWAGHVTTYYVKNGKPTSEQDNVRQALRFARRLHGTSPAETFGPLALKAVRQAMVEAGRCRGLVNKDVGRVRAMFKWAASNEMLPAATYQALLTVGGLAKGRDPRVKEAEPVTPAPEADVWAVHAAVRPHARVMIELQWWTGMRPGEVVLLRTCDVDRSGDVWVYTPAAHKREHHGLPRRVAIGPRAQAVLKPWLKDDQPEQYLFRPKEAMERSQVRRAMIRPGEHYRVSSYRNIVRRACGRLGVPVWFPNQLRHNAATRIRQRFGLEASRTVLGHESVDTTLIYAERDGDEAMRVMRELG